MSRIVKKIMYESKQDPDTDPDLVPTERQDMDPDPKISLRIHNTAFKSIPNRKNTVNPVETSNGLIQRFRI